MQKSQRKCQERRNKRRDEMSGLYKKIQAQVELLHA